MPLSSVHIHPSSPSPPLLLLPQFYITTSETAWLDEKCVVIGAVTDAASLETLSLVERLGTEWGAPKRQVLISDSGQSNFK